MIDGHPTITEQIRILPEILVANHVVDGRDGLYLSFNGNRYVKRGAKVFIEPRPTFPVRWWRLLRANFQKWERIELPRGYWCLYKPPVPLTNSAGQPMELPEWPE